MKKRRILITGASGLVGTNAAHYFLQQGFDVRILTRKSSVPETRLKSGCEMLIGGLTDKEAVNRATKDCDYVLHAASQVHDTGISMQQYLRVNYEGTKNIADACLKNNVRKLIYISTASLVNGGKKHCPATELNDFELVHLNSGYLYSKYLAHQYILEQVAKQGLPAVILSPGFVLGAFDMKPSSGKLLLHAHNRKLLWVPPGRKHYVHVQDVVTAIATSIEKAEIGAHYLICNEGFSYKAFYNKLNHLVHQNSFIIVIPKWILLFLGILGSLVNLFFRQKVALTYEAAYMLCLENYYSNKKSCDELELHYQSTERIIVDAVGWFANIGRWKTKTQEKGNSTCHHL
ncbi:MAG TPA: NAD-dependent epimerase/dehydratase family protein [Flavipsychrobacter sp.]|nr:NAD-dependent epimerase/dehydratase family protein [Flavipsychrobacter sp.]